VCELKQLALWLSSPHGAQPPVKFDPIPGAMACTVFAFKRLSHGFYLAVATTEHVNVYKYNSGPCSFSVQKVTYIIFLFFSILYI